MMRTWTGLVLLALCLGQAARAQSGAVEGLVRDEAGRPLPGVNVIVEGTTLGAASDLDGRYAIAGVPEGAHVVAASAVGYRTERRPVVIVARGRVTADFVLAEVALESGEVVVTAARREQQVMRVPVSLAVIPPEDLAARNIVALDEALRYVPGVQMADNQVNIRGSSGFSFNTGSRVLLLLDGMPLLSPDREGIPFDALPMAQVARIEVLKGPGSALYGGGALGGVIHVITKDFPERPETSARLYGGAYLPVRHAVWRAAWDDADVPRPYGGGTLTHARRLGPRLGFWANLAYRHDTGYTNFGAEDDLDVFTKIGWRPATAMRLNVLAGFTRRQSDVFLYWNGLRDVLNPGSLRLFDDPAGPTGTNDNRTHQVSLLPSFTHVVSPTVFYALRGRVFGALIRPLDEEGRPREIDAGTLGARYGGEFQINWSPEARRNLTAGVTADALATRSSFFRPETGTSDVHAQPEGAVFGQWEETVLGRFELSAGLRFDFYRLGTGVTERKLSPKLNAAWPLGDDHHLRAAYGQGFRVPSLAERFVDNQDFLPLVRNLDLRPETSTGYEVGLRSRFPVPFGALTTDAALFWNEYERLVEPKFIAAQRAFQFVNLTRARIRGAEATLDAVTTGERVRLQLAYTFLDADDLTDDRPLAFRSRHLFKAALTARTAGVLDGGLDVRIASPFERVDSDFSRFVPDAETVVPVRVLDARIGLRWRGYHLSLLVNNLLDYYYAERPAILAPPRHLALQLRADW